ncbi:MAG: hypothetical protein ABIH34_03260 [Nanoarchaeota archaeon]
MTNFYENHDPECGGSSVAHVLHLQGDAETAEQFYNGFRKHPFVLPSGEVELKVLPKIISELTQGKYKGICYSNLPVSREDLERDYGQQADEIEEVIKQMMEAGNVRPQSESGQYAAPHVAAIYWTDDNAHAIVVTEEGHFISDGTLYTEATIQGFFGPDKENGDEFEILEIAVLEIQKCP